LRLVHTAVNEAVDFLAVLRNRKVCATEIDNSSLFVEPFYECGSSTADRLASVRIACAEG
jgi:hypothetical protein